MAMTYETLIATKGNSGAIATWVNYTKLDIPVIVDEAQALLYGEARLRTREMMTSTAFYMAANTSYIALPTGFLDPIGRIRMTSFNDWIAHKDSGFVEAARSYQENTGSLGTNALTTTSGSNTVAVNLTNHNLTQDSTFNIAGATAFNGVTPNGTFVVNGITDANDFTIDITPLGTTPSGSGAGGGAVMTYVSDQLTPGTPKYFGVWDELLRFDCAFFQGTMCRLQFYQSLPLLSATNLTNFLTNRYPQLMRVACMAAAADFMKDSEEYQEQFGRLTQMVQAIAIENDMQYRGMEYDTVTP